MSQILEGLIPRNKHTNKNINKIFVLSTGRAGTLWMAHLIDKMYHNVLAVHEAPPPIKLISLKYYSGEIDLNRAAWALRVARLNSIEKAREYYKKSAFVEVNNNLFNLADPLRKAFEGCKIIGLVRDGRTFIKSMAKRQIYTRKPSLPEFISLDFAQWEKWDLIQKYSWCWNEKIKGFIDKVDYLVKIEDLIAQEGVVEWNKVAKIMEIGRIQVNDLLNISIYNKMRKIKIHAAKEASEWTDFENWKESDQQKFWDIAGDTMKCLGYI